METVRVEARRRSSVRDVDADLETVRVIATLLDTQFEIAGVKFGWDAIIGLIPVAGDLVTTAIGLYPVWLARQHRVSKWVQARMLANLGIDLLAGSVPVVGDVFDVAFKAELKNLQLLEKALKRR